MHASRGRVRALPFTERHSKRGMRARLLALALRRANVRAGVDGDMRLSTVTPNSTSVQAKGRAVNRLQKKWRKLRHHPEQFLRDMRSPTLRVIAYPWVWLLALLWRVSSSDSAKVGGVAGKHQVEASDDAISYQRPRNMVAHLFKDRFKPVTRGRVSLPWRIRSPNVYIPEMLDFAECVAPFDNESMAKTIDVFCTWGVTDNVTHDSARRMAAKYGRPLLSLEYGFVSSLDIALRGGPQLSIVISREVMYYDSTQPSYMEERLNSPSYELSDAQRERARRCIDQIVAKKVSKYNHAPEIDLLPRLNPNVKQRVLLIDQRFGDQSVSMGLADTRSFELMLEQACALEDCEVSQKFIQTQSREACSPISGRCSLSIAPRMCS